MEEVINAFERMGPAIYSPIDLDDFNNLNERESLDDFCELLVRFQTSTNNKNIGLLLGKHIEPGCFTTLGHLVMACHTVGEALSLVAKLQPLIIDCADSEYQQHTDCVDFSWTPSGNLKDAKRIVIDLILSATRHFGIWATGITEPFLATNFQYPEPSNIKLHQEIFGPEVSFSQPANSFSIPMDWYSRTIRTANKDLKPIIYSKAEQQLKEIQQKDDVVLKLAHVIESLLMNGHATIESAAELLFLSPRSLQRHLRERSTSFSEVLQRVRYKKAEYLLKNTQLPLTEIAAQLGYNELSSFSYAYKNWKGVSPKQIRTNALCNTAS